MAMAFYQVEEVMELLGVSRSKAYKIIQDLNDKLKKKGYITIAGKVPKKFFNEKFYCDENEIAREKATVNTPLRKEVI